MDTIVDLILNNELISNISSVIKFILGLPNYIINTLSSLPSEITSLLGTALIIIVAIFLYRFVRWV